MALASKQIDGYSGSTRLHCDLCDAINLLVYCTPPTGTALWHIFKVNDVDKIRSYLRDTPKFMHPHDNDPIHSQRYYLGPSDLAALKAMYNVVPFTIHQAVGEAVFIPAGCPHQVCSQKNKTK
jgi:JmjC domain, hydroxylase